MSHQLPLPEGWELRRLGDLCRFINGFAFSPDEWAEEGRPIIRIQNLNGGTDFNYWDGPIDPRYEVATGDLLFSWSGNRGTSFGPYIWRGLPGLINQHIFKVIPEGNVCPQWLFHALDDVRAEAEKKAHGGSGLVHVRHSDLVEYLVPTPPLDEQVRIANVLDAFDTAIWTAELHLGKLQTIKSGLIPDLLSGRVRVPSN